MFSEISPLSRTNIMSGESPFLRSSSVFNKVSQKTLNFNSGPAISNQQKYWSVASFVHLQGGFPLFAETTRSELACTR